MQKHFGMIEEYFAKALGIDAEGQKALRERFLVAERDPHRAYYRFALSRSLALTSDVQIVINPASNDDADTVVVLGMRLHLQL